MAELQDLSQAAPRYIDVPRFEVEDYESALAHLKEHGFCVFRALEEAECEESMRLLWDYLEGLNSGLDRRDPRTWTPERWPPGVGTTGILPWFNIGHSAFMWFVRTRPRVAAAFRKVWGVRDDEPMVSSFDGCCVWRPGVETTRGWHHVDQDALRGDGFEMVQGLVNLLDVTETSGGNLLVDRSHVTVFPRLKDQYPKELAANDGDDYFELPRTDAVFQDDRDAVVCLLKRGDLLLWDSRTVHSSTPPSDDNDRAGLVRDDNDRAGLVRACAFVCMVPRAKCPLDVRRERRRAYQEGVTTSHWPTKLIRTDGYDSFGELPDCVRLRFTDPESAPPTPEIDALVGSP